MALSSSRREVGGSDGGGGDPTKEIVAGHVRIQSPNVADDLWVDTLSCLVGSRSGKLKNTLLVRMNVNQMAE